MFFQLRVENENFSFYMALAWILYLQLTGQQHPFRRVNVRVIQRARAVQRLLGALLLLPNHFRPEIDLDSNIFLGQSVAQSFAWTCLAL